MPTGDPYNVYQPYSTPNHSHTISTTSGGSYYVNTTGVNSTAGYVGPASYSPQYVQQQYPPYSRGINPWDILDIATTPWVSVHLSKDLIEQAIYAVENGIAVI